MKISLKDITTSLERQGFERIHPEGLDNLTQFIYRRDCFDDEELVGEEYFIYDKQGLYIKGETITFKAESLEDRFGLRKYQSKSEDNLNEMVDALNKFRKNRRIKNSAPVVGTLLAFLGMKLCEGIAKYVTNSPVITFGAELFGIYAGAYVSKTIYEFVDTVSPIYCVGKSALDRIRVYVQNN